MILIQPGPVPREAMMAGHRRSSLHIVIRLAAVLSTLVLAPRADATIIPVSQTREVTTFAFLNGDLGGDPQRTDETIQSAEPGTFTEDAVCHLEDGASEVTAQASQSSIVSADGITATMSASAEGVVVFPTLSTLGIASTSLTYDFDVDEATPCHILTHVIAEEFGVVDLRLRIRNGATLIQRQFFDTDETFDQTIMLPVGSYQLTFGGGGDGGMGPTGSGSSFMSLDFSMSFPVASSVAGGLTGEPAPLKSTWGAAKHRFE
jgi:hypothetical protein